MSLDPDVYNLLRYQQARHAEAEYVDDMDELAAHFGCAVIPADASRLIGTDLHIQRGLKFEARRSALAHELSHKLTQERDDEHAPSYEEVILHRHSSVPDMPAHLERLAEHGQDLLTMPDHIVQTVLNLCGTEARAVWVLHQQQRVYLHEALRRIVHFDESARIAGFIAMNGVIHHAYSYGYYLPAWVGDRAPIRGEGLTVFPVPGRPSMTVGLVTVGDWEAA